MKACSFFQPIPYFRKFTVDSITNYTCDEKNYNLINTIYKLRRRILEKNNLKEKVFEMMEQVVTSLCDLFTPDKQDPENWDYKGLDLALHEMLPNIIIQGLDRFKKRDDLKAALLKTLKDAYAMRESELNSNNMRELECLVMLRVLDTKWIEQLHNMDTLREGIGLRAYGQRDPLIEYKIEGYRMYQDMMLAAREEIISLLFKAQIVREGEEVEAPKRKQVTYGGPAKEASAPTQRKNEKVGRNDPCPCGSGKKYKKCCLKKEAN